MTSFLPDTSCIVAAVSSWHEGHERASREIEKRLAARQRMIVAGPALIEAYSVLTRLPAPHRISPSDARSLLQENFLRSVQTVVLSADGYRSLLKRAPDENLAGGRTYDAVIAACARKAGVHALLTLNARDFESLAGADLEIVVP